MQWNNEKVMELLEQFQTEPCLWDPRRKAYKYRGAQNDAWRRIAKSLTFTSTIDELKKKKESLMGYYRIHLNRYKKSLKSAEGASDLYTTNWFAFDYMHSFLKPIYDKQPHVNNKSNLELSTSHNSGNVSESEVSEGQETSCHSEGPTSVPNVTQHQGLLAEALNRPSSFPLNYNKSIEHCFITNKQASEISTSQKQKDESSDYVKLEACPIPTHCLDEYDHFAFMIAAKIRKLNDFYERESVMNTIQHLVFQSLMKNKNSGWQEAPYSSPTPCWTVASNIEPVEDMDTKTNITLYSMSLNNSQGRSNTASPNKE